jgi:phosphinothricin acetyltransferase
VGDLLVAALINEAERLGLWKLLSRIFPFNEASRALCRKHGFREVGVYEKHARLDGRWLDVVIVERLISANVKGVSL